MSETLGSRTIVAATPIRVLTLAIEQNRGSKGVSVDPGMVLSVGFAAENKGSMPNLRKQGFNAMRESYIYALLDSLRNPANAVS
jgi:hypothetical protein